jgi:dipeptide/tripeptide permease
MMSSHVAFPSAFTPLYLIKFFYLPFVPLANEMLERVAGFGLNTNMIMYLTKQYHLSNVTAGATLFAWAAAANFAPIPGALIADMYIGRFVAISIGSIACLTVSVKFRPILATHIHFV